MKEKEKFLCLTWKLLCIIGLIVQNFMVTVDYFKYPVTSSVTFKTSNNFVPPAFHICIELPFIRKKELFPASSPCNQKPSSKQDDGPMFTACMQDMLFNYSVNQIMDRITVDLTSNVLLLVVHLEDGTDLRLENFTGRIEEYFADHKKCLKILNNADPNYVVLNSMISKLSSSYMRYFAIHFRPELTLLKERKVFMFLAAHEPGSYLRGFSINNIRDANLDFNAKTYTYIKSHTEYLPPPYWFKCADFTTFENREECVERCIKSSIQADFGFLASAAQLTLTGSELKQNLMFNHALNRYRYGPNKVLNDYFEKCIKRCPVDCNTIRYSLQLSGYFNEPDVSYIAGMENKLPTTHVVFSPKTSLLEYFIHIASVMGIWLGISFHDGIIILKPVVKRILSKQQANHLDLIKSISHSSHFHVMLVTQFASPSIIGKSPQQTKSWNQDTMSNSIQ